MNTIINPIRGKVARILNIRQFIMNIGSDDGVELGMCFSVMDEDGLDVIDPDTKENLGSMDIMKVMVRVTQLQPKLSVGSTFRFRRENKGGHGGPLISSAALSDLFTPPKLVTIYETLEGKEYKKPKTLKEEDSVVSVGDVVVQVPTPKSNEIKGGKFPFQGSLEKSTMVLPAKKLDAEN